MYEFQYEEKHLDNNDIIEVNNRIKKYYNNTFLEIIDKYFISKSNTKFINEFKSILFKNITNNSNTDFNNDFKNITNNLNTEFINDFKNIINNLITEDINIYKYINEDIMYILRSVYCINITNYIDIIKTINLNEKDDNYKRYYKQLQDKLNSINLCI